MTKSHTHTPAQAPFGVPNIENGKKVLVIYTGGTIGMKPDEDGSLSVSKGHLESIVSLKNYFFRIIFHQLTKKIPSMVHVAATIARFPALQDSPVHNPRI
jgi:L-asparaginase/Glu-tRNA(Gln) amidotransferase subunit D